MVPGRGGRSDGLRRGLDQPNQDGSGRHLRPAVHDAGGAPGSEFPVNTYTHGRSSQQPAVAVTPGRELRRRLAEATTRTATPAASSVVVSTPRGRPQGVEFRVNSYTTTARRSPPVSRWMRAAPSSWRGAARSTAAATASSRSATTPRDCPEEASSRSTRSPRLNQFAPERVARAATAASSWSGTAATRTGAASASSAGATTPPVRPGEATSRSTRTRLASQRTAAIACDPDGDYVVAWQSLVPGRQRDGVFGQRYGDLIFQDGFESADLAAGTRPSTDGGDLGVSGAAGLGGTAVGLQAVVDDTNPLFVRDDSRSSRIATAPASTSIPRASIRARRTIRRIRLLIAFNGSNERLVTLVLRRLGGAYSVRARVRLDDGTRADTPFVGISDAPHFFEFDWQRASAPGASNGQFFALARRRARGQPGRPGQRRHRRRIRAPGRHDHQGGGGRDPVLRPVRVPPVEPNRARIAARRAMGVHAVLLISCPDQKGLVAAVSDFLYRNDGNIIHADQHTDLEEGVFLQRVEWELDGFAVAREEIADAFRPIAERFGMRWELRFSRRRPARGDLRLEAAATACTTCSGALAARRVPRPRSRSSSATTTDAARGRRGLRRRVRTRAGRRRQTQGGARRHDSCELLDEAAHRPGRARALHAGAERRACRAVPAAGSSTSTTRSCRRSRARGPTTRRTSAASSSSARRRTT